MARPIRIQYPGATYHVMARGTHGQEIFQDDQDRQRFLETLGEACEKTGFRIHAYVLMGNHYHLLVETPEGNLVAGMKWLLGTYTGRFNRRHKEFGHLFSGRYKALIVDGSGNGYLFLPGAGGHGAGTEPFWGGGAGGGGGAGRAAGGGRVEADRLERGRLAGAAQGRAEEDRAGLGVAFADDDAAGVDRGAAPHGHARVSGVVAATPRPRLARRIR